MKIGIIGATGRAGSFILAEALKRGLAVTAIVRNASKLTVDVPVLEKDLFALTAADLAGFEVVVDAFNAPRGQEELHQSSLTHLREILKGTAVRLLVVGGASSLYLDAKKTQRMIDGIPATAPFYPTAYNMAQAYFSLRDGEGCTYTYVSPAEYFNPHGERTGRYQLNDDLLRKDANGKSEVSMADFAIAIIDLAESGEHVNEHVSVSSLVS